MSVAATDVDRLFELSLDLLCIASTEGFFTRVNPAFERVLGYAPEELLRRPFLDFVHPDDREATVREVQNLAGGRPVVDFENRYQAKDGTWRWLAWRSAPGPGGLIVAVARDVTEQKRMQAQLERQGRELARSNADLEAFAAVASHDLRAPLRAVSHLARWIEEDVDAGNREELRRHIDELRSRVERMQRLVGDLLEYSRAGAAAEEAAERVDTGALARDVVFLLSPPPGFTIEVEPAMPVLTTVRTPLETVLRNLVGNAIKHHDRPDGRIAVSARPRQAGVWEFTVSDDGPGIPPHLHGKLFRMFERLDARKDVPGSGIGLALVERIVSRHGGTVAVSSEGRGATFRFTWPAGGSAPCP